MPVKQATAILNAPGGDAARVQKMMASRPTLNANQRRAPKQALDAFSPEGRLTGRGGVVQQAGPAMMRRLAARQAAGAPPATDADALQTQMRELQGGPASGPPMMTDKVGRGIDPLASQMGGGPGATSMERMPEMLSAVSRPLPPPGAGQGAPPQGQMGGMLQGLQPGGGPGAPPEMQQAVQTAMAGANPGQPFAPGLPPQIMQRLQALRGQGGMGQATGAPQTGGVTPTPQRSFQDFWQGGMAPRGM